MEAYDKNIEGNYNQNQDYEQKPLTPQKRKIIDVLRQGYPNSFSAQDLDDTFKFPVNTAHQYLDLLAKQRLIVKKKEKNKKSKRDVYRYYFEDYNYILNEEESFTLPFAPGYLKYTEKFLNIYDDMMGTKEVEDKIKNVYQLLTEVLSYVFSKRSSGSNIHRLEGGDGCGYNHELRDLIRATLIHLIDDLEMNHHFIQFMSDEKIIDEIRHKELLLAISEARRNGSFRKIHKQ